MSLKNGVYLQVHFNDDLKKILSSFSDKVGISQSKVCENILSLELPRYVESYCAKMEEINEIQKTKTS